MNNVVILTGSNQGNRLANLQGALQGLERSVGAIASASGIYESEPWGYTSQNQFLNQALVIVTDLMPEEVLNACMGIEASMGRKRTGESMQDRKIDIDIMFYGSLVIETPALKLPHPRMQARRFALLPLKELIPDFIHPTLHVSLQTLLIQCEDRSEVRLFMPNPNGNK